MLACRRVRVCVRACERCVLLPVLGHKSLYGGCGLETRCGQRATGGTPRWLSERPTGASLQGPAGSCQRFLTADFSRGVGLWVSAKLIVTDAV